VRKVFSNISESTIVELKDINEEKVLEFSNIDEYEQFQVLVREGYVKKNFRRYSITKQGSELLEAHEMYTEHPDKFQDLIKEDKEGVEYISIKYKKHDYDNDVICTEMAKFEMDKDGLPIVKVNEDSYASLIHRTKGQHWKQYLGEDGRQLIRQKKLSKFYVESVKTGRRYLYIL